MTTTGADGTKYALVVPPDALLFDTKITMTPLAAIDGLTGAPTPQHRVGVQLAPDGLELFARATLQIHPRASVPDGGVSTLGFHGAGGDVGLTLFGQDAGQVSVSVDHFSGYGSFWPVDDDWWRVAERLRQRQIEDRLSNQIAARMGRLRQQELFGTTPEVGVLELMREFATAWDRDVLDPSRELARNGCHEATDAVLAYMAWERQLQLLGDSGADPSIQRPIPAELMTLKRDLCFEEQFQRCRHTGDFEGLMGYFLGHFRQYEMFGREPPDEDVELAHLYLERCGRWDLDVTTIWDSRGPVCHCTHYEELARHFKIKWRPGTAVYGLFGSHADAEADVEPTTLEWAQPGCRIHPENARTDVRSQAEIVSLTFAHGPTPAPQQLKLRLSMGLVLYDQIADCGTQGSPGRYALTDSSGLIGWGLKLSSGYPSCGTEAACGALMFELESCWRFDDGPFHEGPFSAKVHKYGLVEKDRSEITTASVEASLTHTPAP